MGEVSLKGLLDKIDFLIDYKFLRQYGEDPDKVIISRSHVEELTRCGFYDSVQQHVTKKGLEIWWLHELPKEDMSRAEELLRKIPNSLILARTSGFIFKDNFDDMVAYNLSSQIRVGDYIQAR